MKLLVVYVAIVIVGEFIAVGIGLMLEPFSKVASLPTSLVLFFFVFWAGWKLAVRLT